MRQSSYHRAHWLALSALVAVAIGGCSSGDAQESKRVVTAHSALNDDGSCASDADCAANQKCNDGACSCQPSCNGTTCNVPDGCGGSCGCNGTAVCQGNICMDSASPPVTASGCNNDSDCWGAGACGSGTGYCMTTGTGARQCECGGGGGGGGPYQCLWDCEQFCGGTGFCSMGQCLCGT